VERIAPTYIDIDLEALRCNYRELKKRIPRSVKTLCVVKSNAYGHGAPRVAKALEEEGADAFGVGTVDEAIMLRQAGIKKTILILLGLIDEHFEELLRYQLTPVLYDIQTAERLHAYLSRSAKPGKLSVHLKVDTGMTRLGILPREFRAFCERLKTLSTIHPIGLMSHLAEAGDETFTRRQREIFLEAQSEFQRYFPGDRIYHLANSQAVIDFGGRSLSPPRTPHLTSKKSPLSSEGNLPPLADDSEWMVRLGLALYGAYPLERDKRLLKLKPILQWKTKIVAIKKVPSRTPVSYNRVFTTKKESLIGVLPVGYADGYFRVLSNQAKVLVRGKEVPITGTICMDMMMVDLSSIPSAKVGDEVMLIGKQGKAEIRAEELAAKAKTISYEVFCRISPRVPRRYR
jgi:alanine racemase